MCTLDHKETPMPKFLLAVGLAILMSAEVQQLQTRVQLDLSDALNAVAKIAIPDLQAASADAKAHNDIEAAQCWDGLVPIVEALEAQGAQAPRDRARRSTLQPIRSSIREGEALRLSTRAQFGGGSAKGVTDGWMGKLVIWLGTLGLVVGFILAALFLVPGPMVKMKGRR
jgi:hypothetical protein